MRIPLEKWTVDLGRGPHSVTVPHVWHLDAPLDWEGPAIYAAKATVPMEGGSLVFHGASHQAVVCIDGLQVADHRGIWDRFSVDLADWSGREVEIVVHVTKNGGKSWPVASVASGFLPYVYGTFGGLFREVEIVVGEELPPRRPAARVTVEGSKILVDGEPFYARGVLTWGWHPDLGTPHLPPDRIAKEIEQVQLLGFNLIKFCLWMPPHDCLEQMKRAGLMAWLELPLWLPAGDDVSLAGFRTEIMRIVDQYAHHENILAWTLGCELSESTPASFREELVNHIRERTGAALVKDNSGGAEMYGGDPREFGDFEDFHPYCDTHFYPQVLDSLLPGARPHRPILLGEFNDYDVCRDLRRIADQDPYWASPDADRNSKGVRWQYDLPKIMERFASDAPLRDRLPALMESSRSQSLFMRKFVQEAVRARSGISGYVVTGWADTPISSAGFVDDWGGMRFAPEDIASWNSPDCLFLIPRRSPPWVHGGNRPGWEDPLCRWSGDVLLQLGLHSTEGGAIETPTLHLGTLEGHASAVRTHIDPLDSQLIATAFFEGTSAGTLIVTAKCGSVENQWDMTLVDRQVEPWEVCLDDPRSVFEGLSTTGIGPVMGTNPPTCDLIFLVDVGTIPGPFWREACHEWSDDFWIDSGWPQAWHRFSAIASDRAIDPDWLDSEFEKWTPIWLRTDTRTFRELPIAAVAHIGARRCIVTTLRPFGGLTGQPSGVSASPAGTLLLRHLLQQLRSCTS